MYFVVYCATLACFHRKRLKERLCVRYPSLPHALLDELLPSKCNLSSLQVSPRGIVRNVIVFTVNGEPLFFEYDDFLCPTGNYITDDTCLTYVHDNFSIPL